MPLEDGMLKLSSSDLKWCHSGVKRANGESGAFERAQAQPQPAEIQEEYYHSTSYDCEYLRLFALPFACFLLCIWPFTWCDCTEEDPDDANESLRSARS
jgi:hypothetical protein